jgi:hypothetical protein
MKRRVTPRDVLPLARLGRAAPGQPTGEAFRPEWLDFERGIRVGNLEPHERITQILKYHLEQRYHTPFITDRWGRGVYWQWICWLPRANRDAKPVSNRVNFGCAKLFITLDRGRQELKCGLQVERGILQDDSGAERGSAPPEGWVLREDWDWHRLTKLCTAGSPLDKELGRLINREGFHARVEGAGAKAVFGPGSFPGAARIRAAARACPPQDWAAFQLYYPLKAAELRASTGFELVSAMSAAFGEVVGAMNLCMQVPLIAAERVPGPQLLDRAPPTP